jgi:hypothetical protein
MLVCGGVNACFGRRVWKSVHLAVLRINAQEQFCGEVFVVRFTVSVNAGGKGSGVASDDRFDVWYC